MIRFVIHFAKHIRECLHLRYYMAKTSKNLASMKFLP